MLVVVYNEQVNIGLVVLCNTTGMIHRKLRSTVLGRDSAINSGSWDIGMPGLAMFVLAPR